MVEVLGAKVLDLNPKFGKRLRLFPSYSIANFQDDKEKNVIIKSHLKFGNNQRNHLKTIYLVRDGRDSLMSYYFYKKSHDGYSEDWDSFFSRFVDSENPSNFSEKVLFDQMGNWSENVQSYMEKKNVLVMKYEDILNDQELGFKSIFDFVGIPLKQYENPLNSILEKKKEEILKKDNRDKEVRRRGSTRNWEEFFSKEQLDAFNRIHGEVLKKFNYPV